MFLQDEFTKIFLLIVSGSVKKIQGLNIYCFCLMPNHVHFIADSNDESSSNTLRSFKSHTAKGLMAAITKNPQECRKELFLHQFNYYGKKAKTM
jgi:REP element-mobilizing transposase RayT